MGMIKLFTVGILFLGIAQIAHGAASPQVAGPNIISGKSETVKGGPKGLVVVFLSAKCPCSKSHTPELVQLAKEFKDFNFVAVHSNMDEKPELARDYFSELKLPFSVIQDYDARIADGFKALKTPHVFILDPSETVVFQGGMSDSKD